MNKFFLIPTLLLVLVGAACTTTTDADTPREKLVVLEYSYQAALKTVSSMVDTGIIVGDKATKASELLEQASIAMKTARSVLLSGDDAGATQYIVLANAAVAQLITYLQTQQGDLP